MKEEKKYYPKISAISNCSTWARKVGQGYRKTDKYCVWGKADPCTMTVMNEKYFF